jgi:pSer/pThr/pTyr-binding forkhead associated (FHA) protein
MSDDLPADLYANAMQRPDDGSTLLEPLDTLQAAEHHTAFEPQHATAYERAPPAAYPPLQVPPVEEAFRPKLRAAVPRLTILDDGETEHGEMIRIRDATTLIGRTEGAVRLPHDQRISARHAEIVRTDAGPTGDWILRDLDSKTGTFVRCLGTDLRPDRLIVLGSRRFRFQYPVSRETAPTLVETTNANPDQRLVIPLQHPFLSIGRPRWGNNIELDDPLIATYHAQIVQHPGGIWRLEAKPSQNGIWAQVRSIRLTRNCRFQCGEQQFLFVILPR